VIKAVKGTIAAKFKAFIDDFRAVSLRSLATVEIAANVKVRLIEKKGIIEGTKATIL
jgi:hypothetical protein